MRRQPWSSFHPRSGLGVLEVVLPLVVDTCFPAVACGASSWYLICDLINSTVRDADLERTWSPFPGWLVAAPGLALGLPDTYLVTSFPWPCGTGRLLCGEEPQPAARPAPCQPAGPCGVRRELKSVQTAAMTRHRQGQRGVSLQTGCPALWGCPMSDNRSHDLPGRCTVQHPALCHPIWPQRAISPQSVSS